MPPTDDLLWKQYSLYVDLYKFYMELTVKINLFYYGITGAILSFYFTHPATPFVTLALGLPILMSVVLAGIFFYGASLMPILRQDLFALRDKLGLTASPDLGILIIVLRAFASLLLVVAVILTLFLFCEKRPNQRPEPTSAAVMPAAHAPGTPAAPVAHP